MFGGKEAVAADRKRLLQGRIEHLQDEREHFRDEVREALTELESGNVAVATAILKIALKT